MGKQPIVLDQPIAWVCRTYESGGKTEVEILREGMSRDEILAAFPPYRNDLLPFCRMDLIKAIICEAYQEARQGTKRQRNNIRGFWYERIFHTLIAVMGESGDSDNINSIQGTVSAAWKELVEEGWVTYRALNLYSEKEDSYNIAVRENSPYPTAIVVVEKASLQEVLQDIADTYEISFCCTGGQSSRAAAMAYCFELEQLGIGLDQEFTVYSFCDFDPEGWDIPRVFAEHLAIKVTGTIRLVRLGLLKEQLGQSVIEHQAIPYSLDARSERSRKTKHTKYERFIAETGGLFLDGEIPARVELNIYEPAQIREKIIAGLAQHLDGFPYQVRAVKGWIAHRFAGWVIPDELDDEVYRVYAPYYTAIEGQRGEIRNEMGKRAPEARQRIVELRREIAEQERIIEGETVDLSAALSALDGLQASLDGARLDEVYKLRESPHVTEADYESPEDAFEHIESNGGWREWMDDVGLDQIKADRLAAAARGHREFAWLPDWSEQQNLDDWIEARLLDTVCYDDPEGPDGTPERLIARALGH